MTRKMTIGLTALMMMFSGVGVATGDVYELLTGVAPGTSPGAELFPFGPADGQRLAGTPSAAPTAYAGDPLSPPLYATNQFGAASFMFRRGNATGPTGQFPIVVTDYLGGPRLDLDGDLGNGVRSLTPIDIGGGSLATPVAMGGPRSFLDLSIGGGSVALNNFDATATNMGFPGFAGDIAVTVNTLAGTSNDGTPGAAINPAIDTRLGTVTPTVTPGVSRIDGLGYETWQDSIGFSSSTDILGSLQYLGTLGGYLIERDGLGNFPTLAGTGLGSTLWPSIDTAQVGNTFTTANGLAGGSATISDTVNGEDITLPGPANGGLPLADFGGDLGAYLDAVIIPAIHPNADSFVYLESAGFGMNNSFDPTFGDSVSYDVVFVAQSIPEPSVGVLVLTGLLLAGHRRRNGC